MILGLGEHMHRTALGRLNKPSSVRYSSTSTEEDRVPR